MRWTFSNCSGARNRLLGLSAATAGGADVVEGDGAGAEEYKAKGQGGEGEGQFVSAVTDQPVVEVHLGDGDGEIDADAKSGNAGEQAEQHEESAEELGKGGEVGRPAGKSEAGDQVSVVMKSAENLVITVGEHNRAQGEAHHQKREGLQAIKVAHEVPPEKENRLQQRGKVGKQAVKLGACAVDSGTQCACGRSPSASLRAGSRPPEKTRDFGMTPPRAGARNFQRPRNPRRK